MSNRQALYRCIETLLGRDLSWRLGRFLYLGARRELANDPETNGEYALIGWVLDVARQSHGSVDSAVFDVGANVGDWTERALQALQERDMSTFSVHAFEPAPEQYTRLLERLGGALATGRLTVARAALSAESGTARFTVTGPLTGTSALSSGSPAGGHEVDVDVLSLDDVAELGAVKEILLVKVDTEGNDFNVIRGAASLLRQRRIAVLQFEYNWRWVGFGRSLKNVFDAIDGSDYVFGRLTQDRIEIHEAWDPELEHYFETNYVLVRREVIESLPHVCAQFGAHGTLVTRGPLPAR